MFNLIIKRDGSKVQFNSEKITHALLKAGQATAEFGVETSKKLTMRVLNIAHDLITNRIPTVEEVQDIVEEVLIGSQYVKSAKAYILYRDQHAKMREIVSNADVNLIDQYLERLDWQVSS